MGEGGVPKATGKCLPRPVGDGRGNLVCCSPWGPTKDGHELDVALNSVSSVVKNLPGIRSPGWEDLEENVAHSVFLPGGVPTDRESDRLQSRGHTEVKALLGSLCTHMDNIAGDLRPPEAQDMETGKPVGQGLKAQ